jgi:hypothetical protein
MASPARETTPDPLVPVVPVFVSSTWLDMERERVAVEHALKRFREVKFQGMEYFGSRPQGAQAESLAEVDRSALFVGIIGGRWGSGITHDEYVRARELGLPCLLYVKTGPLAQDDEPAARERQSAFRQELRGNQEHLVAEFTAAEDLATRLRDDLHRWIMDDYVAPRMRALLARHAPSEQVRALVDAVRDPEMRAEVEPDLRGGHYAADAAVTRADFRARRDPDEDALALLRGRVHQAWVKDVLEQSLHHEVALALGKELAPETIEAPWSRVAEFPNRRARPLATLRPILDIFEESGRMLLVLGDPGGGKTITLVELLRDLLALHRQGRDPYVAVLLNLSTWKPDPRGLMGWIVRELGVSYAIPRKDAERWLQAKRLVLLLDGLDEVPAVRRDVCVEAINAYLAEFGTPGLAVACRNEEHQALRERLRLVSAVRLQPLTPQQIDDALRRGGEPMAGLRARVSADPELLELSRTPLMLSILMLAGPELDGEAPREPDAAPMDVRRQVFRRYVLSMFRRRQVAPPEENRVRSGLTWLAREMAAQSTTSFSLQRLQPSWVGRPARVAYAVVSALVIACVLGASAAGLFESANEWRNFLKHAMFFGLAAAQVESLRLTLFRAEPASAAARNARRAASFIVFTLAVLLVNRLTMGREWLEASLMLGPLYWLVALSASARRPAADDISMADSRRWSGRHAVRGALVALLLVAFLGVIFTASFDLFESGPDDAADFIGDLVTLLQKLAAHPATELADLIDSWGWIVAPLLGAVVGGLTSAVSGREAGPSARLRATLKQAAVGAFIFAGFALLIGIVNADQGFDKSKVLFLISLGVLGALWNGGLDLIRHFVLRGVLAATRRFPFRVLRFLDRAAQLILLRRVGGGYIFVHRLLLEHFASGAEATAGARTSP